jgi:hypothetical protein
MGIAGALDSVRTHYAVWSSPPMIGAYAAFTVSLICFLCAAREVPFPFATGRSPRQQPSAAPTDTDSSSPPPTPGPVNSEKWSTTDDGRDISGLLLHVRQNAMSHPGYMRRSPNENPPPYIRIGVRVPCGPLDSSPATSDIRVSFLAFLNRLPIRRLLATMTTIDDSAIWSARDGRGRFNFGAVLSEGSENAPVAWARLLLPQAEGSYYGQDPGRALLILHIEPRTPDGNPAPPIVLPLWRERLVQAFDIPSALSKFLTRDVELASTGSQPAQIAVSLEAPRSMTELVDTGNLTTLPGAPASNSFTGWATADPNGQRPARLVQRWLRDMCDSTLYLDGYEPTLAAPGDADKQPDPESGQPGPAEQDNIANGVAHEPTTASLNRAARASTRSSSTASLVPEPRPTVEALRSLITEGKLMQARLPPSGQRTWMDVLPADLRRDFSAWETRVSTLLAAEPGWLAQFKGGVVRAGIQVIPRGAAWDLSDSITQRIRVLEEIAHALGSDRAAP